LNSAKKGKKSIDFFFFVLEDPATKAAKTSALYKKKEEDKEKKYLGKLSYSLEYDFDKNAFPIMTTPGCRNQTDRTTLCNSEWGVKSTTTLLTQMTFL
uniref:Tub domain-containing protein n=1 Tax=Enterobius vermicularis TaxID=51028 RepID=A0A0N4UU97_ENTVE